MAQSSRMPVLQGRLAELNLLEARLQQAAAGTLQAMLVEGEAGIGKSRILEAAIQAARESGFRVFVGRAEELERARPFGPLAEALVSTRGAHEAMQAEIASLLSGSRASGQRPIEPTRDPGRQFRVVDAFVDLVEEMALAAPVLIALEDLHWADPSTLLAVRSLARRLSYLQVAILVTLRPFPREPGLQQLMDALIRDGAAHLELQPLDERAVVALATELTTADPGTALLDVVAGAAGNPLFVIELVNALREDGAIKMIEGHAEAAAPALPPSLRLTILRRLTYLPEEALEALRVASVIGSTFSIRDVAAVMGRSSASLLRAIREPMRAGIIEARQARLGFRHDLIRDAIYGDLPEDVRAALHLEAGRRLAAAGAPALQVAEHLALGARPGDTEAVGWLGAAAREAAGRAPAIAVELLERALALAGDSAELRPPILADLVPTLLRTGRPQRAETLARDTLAERPPAKLEGRLRLSLVRALAAQDRYEDVIEEVGHALRHSRPTADLRSQLHAEAANAHAFTGDRESAEGVAREAVATGTPAGSAGAETGLLVLSDAARGRGDFLESLQYAERALEQAGARGGDRVHWRPEIFRAMTLRQLDRLEEAETALQQGRRTDEQLGNVAYLPVYHYESATILFDAGRWDDATAQAETGLGIADEVGLEMLISWPRGLLALIAIHRDDLDVADAWLAAIEGRPTVARPAGLWSVMAHSLLAEARGDPAVALVTLERAWHLDVSRGVVHRQRSLGPGLARLALAADDRELADRVARALEATAALTPVPGLEGAALRCRGLVDDDVQLLVQSVEKYRLGPRPFECASACEDAAAALARSGRSPEATAHFDSALEIYDMVGAHRDAARALASARRLGIGRKRRGARRRPASGWESLTPAELDVVRLASEGLTNPEIGRRLFISRRTVQTHLSHAFQKLSIRSRVDLAAGMARRDPKVQVAEAAPAGRHRSGGHDEGSIESG